MVHRSRRRISGFCRRGRLLPTTSVDAYGAEIASWYGVPPAELQTIFPNAANFFDSVSTPYPLGILQPV